MFLIIPTHIPGSLHVRLRNGGDDGDDGDDGVDPRVAEPLRVIVVVRAESTRYHKIRAWQPLFRGNTGGVRAQSLTGSRFSKWSEMFATTISSALLPGTFIKV